MYWGSQLVPPNESNQLDLNLTQIMKVQGQIPDLVPKFWPWWPTQPDFEFVLLITCLA